MLDVNNTLYHQRLQKAHLQTPMMRQYLEMKILHLDKLLFYRMGDFYELFFEDAERGSRVLDLTLTHRGQSAGEPVPMAGIPAHSAAVYWKRLLNTGLSLAVCEQLQSTESGALMKREVVRVLTPGTLIEEDFLEGQARQWLAACVEYQGEWAVAWLELVSGLFHVKRCPAVEDVQSLLERLQAKELLYPVALSGAVAGWPKTFVVGKPLASRYFSAKVAEELIKDSYHLTALTPLDLTPNSAAVCVVGAILQYLQETHQQNLSHLRDIRWEHDAQQFYLDAQTRRHLEIFQNLQGGTEHTAWQILHHTHTPMGSRVLHDWLSQPTCDQTILRHRHESIEAMQQSDLYGPLRTSLRGMSDFERITTRLQLKSIRPGELAKLRDSLDLLPNIVSLIESSAVLYQRFPIAPIPRLTEVLHKALVASPPALLKEDQITLAPGYDAELDEWRSLSQNVNGYLLELEERERQKTQLPMKLGYNRVHGYYLELSRHQANRLPAYYHRLQTLKNTERFVTPELKQLEEKILLAQTRAWHREKWLFEQLLEELQRWVADLRQLGQQLAELDVLANFAYCAHSQHWVKPFFQQNKGLNIQKGRHLVIEHLTKTNFTPNDVEFSDERTAFVITGPNMGGKSTYMRQIALIVWLAHTGCFVPAQSVSMGPIRRLFSRIGASDQLSQGHSTFMLEMIETAHILRHAQENTLVIVDEVGRGTNSLDGVAIAWACLEALVQSHAFVLFATHFFELSEMAEHSPRVKNLHLEVKTIGAHTVFTHQVLPGAAAQSYALLVAKMAGIPETVLKLAETTLQSLRPPYDPAVSQSILNEILQLNDVNTEALQAKLLSWQQRLKRQD